MSEKEDDKQKPEDHSNNEQPKSRWHATFGEKGDRKFAEKVKAMMNKGKIKDTE